MSYFYYRKEERVVVHKATGARLPFVPPVLGHELVQRLPKLRGCETKDEAHDEIVRAVVEAAVDALEVPNMKVTDLRVATLPDAEQRVYRFVRGFLKKNFGVPPTIRQVMYGASVSSTSLTSTYLQHLAARGLLVKAGAGARAYTVRELAKCAEELGE